MKEIFLAVLIIFCAILYIPAQERLDYFLPDDVTYNQNIPTPEDFFNQQMGEWHLTHDQIYYYMKEVAAQSERAVIEEYARSYENRPLIHLVFTSEDNQKNLNHLKNLHVNNAKSTESVSNDEVPLVINLGYSVHGNESSAANSSVITAYYLAAAQGDKINKLLQNTIILVDPCLNPDGFTRHSTWANMHESSTPVTSNDSRQFNEVWPGGRTNHYWFDLNRDYLLLVHPESRGRVEKFYEWLPNIVTDHHEMESNSTFFFQPGVPSRNNPLTPKVNYELTNEIAKYHAKYLDKIGSDYFSEERFDDYYFGKGSSFPDINGSIGILFEQAGFRGRIRETKNGIQKLSYGIRNQFTVTLSTLDAAMNLKNELLTFQKEFYENALRNAEKDPVKAYVFGNKNDQIKTQMFIDYLNHHQVEVFPVENEIQLENSVFDPGYSYIVPLKQTQYLMLKTIFEPVTTFADSTFYDVSTWTIPYSLNIPFSKVFNLKNINFPKEKTAGKNIEGKVIGGKSNIAYLFRWNEFNTPRALYEIQNAGLLTKVATKEFGFKIDGKKEKFTYGTVLISAQNQILSADEIYLLISSVAKKTGIDFYGLNTGLSPRGIDLGSNSFEVLKKPEIALLVGGSINSLNAGEIWHLFDQLYKIPVTLAETNRLRAIDLNKYNILIMPDGSYGELKNSEIEKIKKWTQEGGTLIAFKNAAKWASKNEIGKIKFKNNIKPDSTINLDYASRTKDYTLNSISGAIFNTKLDITHPLCYGYLQNEIPVFKTGTSVAETLGAKYSEPVKFTDTPYLTGYVSPQNLERLKNAPVISVQNTGSGKLVSYYENMTFRGIWLGTNKLFSNAVFFGNIIH